MHEIEQAMRHRVRDALAARGWAPIESTALAERKHETAVGPKFAHAYLADFSRDTPGSFMLTGNYWSEGSNALESCLAIVPLDASDETIAEQVRRFAERAERLVEGTYAVRLLRPSVASG